MLSRYAEGVADVGWALAPGPVPDGVVLDVEEHALDRPVELPAQIGGTAVAPVWPWLGPDLASGRRQGEGESCGEKGSVIGSEFETVVPLEPCELAAGQARRDHAAADSGQAAGGVFAQSSRLVAAHG